MTVGTVRRSTHASGLHSVERELAALHREMLHLGMEDARTVRLSVLSLIALCADDGAAHLAQETIEHLAQTHPARAIIVVADPTGEDRVEADLALICSPAAGGQVCAEQVRLLLGGGPALHLASAMNPLLVPDVPVYLWLVGASHLGPSFTEDAIHLGARLILDSDAYDD
ncbi:MAG: glucose-6-phosphate dehydrogenase assembly protein OpcA, partial [Candidatus Dormibacteria bacterium]